MFTTKPHNLYRIIGANVHMDFVENIVEYDKFF